MKALVKNKENGEVLDVLTCSRKNVTSKEIISFCQDRYNFAKKFNIQDKGYCLTFEDKRFQIDVFSRKR